MTALIPSASPYPPMMVICPFYDAFPSLEWINYSNKILGKEILISNCHHKMWTGLESINHSCEKQGNNAQNATLCQAMLKCSTEW